MSTELNKPTIAKKVDSAVLRNHSALTWLWRAVSSTVVYSLLLIFIALGFLLLSESAPRWLWQQAQSSIPELHIDGLSGSLATGLTIKSLSWRNEASALRIDQLALSLSYTQLFAGRLALNHVQVQTLAIQALKASVAEVFVPPSIDLPVRWGLADVRIQQLQWTAFAGVPLILDKVSITAQGQGSQVSISSLSLAYADWQLQAQAELSLQKQWPLQALLSLSGSDLPSQRINLDGDLSALRMRLHGPEKYPAALDVTANVLLPTLPFRGRLSWPQWQPPAQQDWQLEPGAMTFAGSTEAGELVLDLRATLLKTSTIEWSASAPRSAHLAGPLRWQRDGEILSAAMDWQGKIGKELWLVNAQYSQAKPAQTLFKMRLADALVSTTGWPDSGLMASIDIPYLQRFQTSLAGALRASLQWRGAWPDGQGQASIVLKQLARHNGKEPAIALFNNAQLTLAGRVDKHHLKLAVAANQGAITLEAEGGLALQSQLWAGQITQATLSPSQGRWQLKRPTSLSIASSESHLEQACWQQTDTAFSPWQVCAQADLNPQQWLATLTAQAPTGGSLKANFRRDPGVTEPALDADLSWQAINLAALPIALPEGLVLSGRSDADIRLGGTLDQPTLTGQWSVDASVNWPRYGLQWPELTIDGRLIEQRSTWTAKLKDTGNGRLNMTGQAAWQTEISASAQITGDKLAFTYAPWVHGNIAPKMEVTWKNHQLTVNGDVFVSRADITLKSLAASAPKPSADVVVVRNRQGRHLVASDAPNALPLSVYLRIILGDAISLSGYGLDAGLRGQLLLTQSPKTPMAATGEISLKPNAQFAAYGQRLNIEQGRLLFAGALTSPDIRLVASREIDGVKVGIKVTGQAAKPLVALTSDSPMSQDEILSYLLLGRSLGDSPETSAADKQALALSAALNLTGKTGAVGLLGQRLGISDFVIGTQGNSASTEVAVSGRLSPTLWLSIGRGVFQPSQSVTVRYQINRRLSLEALSAIESVITLFYSWRF